MTALFASRRFTIVALVAAVALIAVAYFARGELAVALHALGAALVPVVAAGRSILAPKAGSLADIARAIMPHAPTSITRNLTSSAPPAEQAYPVQIVEILKPVAASIADRLVAAITADKDQLLAEAATAEVSVVPAAVSVVVGLIPTGSFLAALPTAKTAIATEATKLVEDALATHGGANELLYTCLLDEAKAIATALGG